MPRAEWRGTVRRRRRRPARHCTRLSCIRGNQNISYLHTYDAPSKPPEALQLRRAKKRAAAGSVFSAGGDFDPPNRRWPVCLGGEGGPLFSRPACRLDIYLARVRSPSAGGREGLAAAQRILILRVFLLLGDGGFSVTGDPVRWRCLWGRFGILLWISFVGGVVGFGGDFTDGGLRRCGLSLSSFCFGLVIRCLRARFGADDGGQIGRPVADGPWTIL
jgi:hypothetical protein